MSRRSRAREVVLQCLYEDDLNPRHSMEASDRFLRQRLLHNAPLVEFARGLLAGVRRNRPELDRRLALVARNWSLHRMAAIDRNVLRLGAFELLFGDTPGSVAINEALELAKRYGGRQSAPFVNGILDRLLHDGQQPGDAQQTLPPGAS
jgi:N utilization substance protein B